MSMPAMDRPSVYFAHLLDSIVVEEDYSQSSKDPTLSLVCQSCSATVCAVEANDTMRVLLNTALAHEC